MGMYIRDTDYCVDSMSNTIFYLTEKLGINDIIY